MPLVTDYSAVKEIYHEAAARGVSLPSFCVEDRETLEAILAGALETGKEMGVEDLPVVPAWTCRYPGRGQMELLTACGDPVLGTNLMLSDLEAFMGDTSPYRKLRVLPHLDHGFPWLDADIMRDYTDRFASIMCDASEKPFETNIRLTAQYVEEVRGRVLVEGAVDEIFEAGSDQPKNEPTSVEQAERFLRETGVDILVPNVGTEHRSTATVAAYRSDRAKEISSKVGKILCLAWDFLARDGRPQSPNRGWLCEGEYFHRARGARRTGRGAHGHQQPREYPRRAGTEVARAGGRTGKEDIRTRLRGDAATPETEAQFRRHPASPRCVV